MKTMQEKYDRDNTFRAMVDAMTAQIYANNFTPSEMREMAVYACIRYEMLFHKPLIFRVTEETESALRILENASRTESGL